MAQQVFNARFTPTASMTLTSTTFEVEADVFDGTGQFSGFDVAANDVVFLDTYNSITAPYTVSKYIVSSVSAASVGSVTVVLSYADTGDPVDPSEVLGNPGFIARASLNKGYAYHAAPTIHTFPDYITQFSRNYDNYRKLEEDLANIAVTSIKGTFLNNSGSSIDGLTPVRQDSSGNIAAIDPSVESQALKILGVLTSITANGALGTVVFSGRILNVTTSFVFGDILYLSKTGGLTATAPSIAVEDFEAGDFVVRVGSITKNESNPSNKDLLVRLEIVGQL